MIKIKNVMSYVYDELTKLAPTYFEDMDRKEDGSIDVNETSIVYNIDGMFQFTDNKARSEVPLTLDIWYLKKDTFEVEDLVFTIDKLFVDSIQRIDGSIFKFSKPEDFVINISDDGTGDKRTGSNIRRKRVNLLINYYKY